MSNLTAYPDNKNHNSKNYGFRREILAARWIVIISSIILYFSGLGQLPIYRRYNIVKIPGFSWADQYLVTLQLHYIFSAVLIGALIFMAILHLKGRRLPTMEKGERLQTHKYSRPIMAFSMLILVLSGALKVVKNFPQVDLPYFLFAATTLLHNAATVTLLLGALLYLGERLIWKNKTADKLPISGGNP